MTEAKHKNKSYTCDICEASGITASFAAPTALGMHKRIKHNILGASKAAQNYREAKAKEPKANVSPEIDAKRAKWRADAKKYRDRKLGITTTTPEHNSGKYELVSIRKGAYSNGEAYALITVGRIQAFCENEAKKYGISEESFTRRCAELLYASTIR